jgi:hypothetical protein
MTPISSTISEHPVRAFLRAAGHVVCDAFVHQEEIMRFKTLLGLVAIGGAVAYAQKRRGGDLSFEGIKNSLRSTFDNVRGQIDKIANTGGNNASSSSSNEDTGYGSRNASSGYGSADYGSAGVGSSGIGSSNDLNGLNGGRKY